MATTRDGVRRKRFRLDCPRLLYHANARKAGINKSLRQGEMLVEITLFPKLAVAKRKRAAKKR